MVCECCLDCYKADVCECKCDFNCGICNMNKENENYINCEYQ